MQKRVNFILLIVISATDFLATLPSGYEDVTSTYKDKFDLVPPVPNISNIGTYKTILDRI